MFKGLEVYFQWFFSIDIAPPRGDGPQGIKKIVNVSLRCTYF